MSSQQLVGHLADTARRAARTLTIASAAQRRAALLAIADAIDARSPEIIAANEKDMVRGHIAELNSSLLDRLLLNTERVAGIANGARQVAALDDPLG